MIFYKYVRPGESYDRIPARDLTKAEYDHHTAGRTKDEKAIIGKLYERATLIDLTSDVDESTTTRDVVAQPADSAEEATDGNTDGV